MFFSPRQPSKACCFHITRSQTFYFKVRKQRYTRLTYICMQPIFCSDNVKNCFQGTKYISQSSLPYKIWQCVSCIYIVPPAYNLLAAQRYLQRQGSLLKSYEGNWHEKRSSYVDLSANYHHCPLGETTDGHMTSTSCNLPWPCPFHLGVSKVWKPLKGKVLLMSACDISGQFKASIYWQGNQSIYEKSTSQVCSLSYTI